MTEEIKRMDIKEFQEEGFLQEVNRQFFHPLGIALEIIVHEDTDKVELGGIWDYRDDPEGMFFSNEVLDNDKIKKIKDLKDSKRFTRLMAARDYGFKVDGDCIQVRA